MFFTSEKKSQLQDSLLKGSQGNNLSIDREQIRKAAIFSPDSFMRDPEIPKILPAFMRRDRLEQVRVLAVGQDLHHQRLSQLMVLTIMAVGMTFIAHPEYFGVQGQDSS